MGEVGAGSFISEDWLTSSQHFGETSCDDDNNNNIKLSEAASHLAEGTLRALRDISLDEAVELHEALRFWTYRWERPMLSWLEAGPNVWFSENGYNHQDTGKKV